MKIDNERPYHSNGFHELVSNGGPKVDDEPERETKHNLLADKMVEQINPSERSFVKAEHQNGGKTRQIRIEDVSYDKDVVEIKLPDRVVSSDYGKYFVKDVCIDEGVLADQKASAENLVVEKVSQNFDTSMGYKNGDPLEEIRVASVKSAHELKSQIVTLPVTCATDDNTMEKYSSCKVHDLEGNNTTAVFTNLNDKKLSPRQLLSHEGAKHCQQVGTVISGTCENHEPFLNGEAIDQVLSDDCHETGASIASETSNLDCLPVESSAGAMPEEDVVSAALDKTGLSQVNHYNPFISYGSLDDTWEPKYTLPVIVDAVSVVPICPVEKTDSFSDLINNGALRGFDFVETDEARIEDSKFDSVGARSSRLGVQSSEESNDQRGSPVKKTDSFSDLVSRAPGGSDSIEAYETRIKHSRLDSIEESSMLDVQVSEESNDQREDLISEMRTDAAHGTGTSSAEPSDVKSENHQKCEIDAVQDVHDFNPRDVEDGRKGSEDNADSKSSILAQMESAVQQDGSDSAKLMARTGIHNPFESSFSGPSITSDPLTPSGHIGNISLRSDSSTTSTRSFAFPVLQTEWNSSPVKMVKADRRRFRRDRGWGHRILCCKF